MLSKMLKRLWMALGFADHKNKRDPSVESTVSEANENIQVNSNLRKEIAAIELKLKSRKIKRVT